MGVTERVWNSLTSIIKPEDKVIRQNEAVKNQQIKIENLTERMIKLETTLDLLIHTGNMKNQRRKVEVETEN